MKCVITILQNKRVALPTIFNRHCLPMMCSRFRGEVKLYHIFHDAHSTHSHMASNKLLGKEGIERVKTFTELGFFSGAVTLSHKETCDFHPSLPSFKYALDIALEEKADFHLWLEDDAIVYDLECDRWATTLGAGDAGLYTNTAAKQMINTAYFLSTREFDLRYANILAEYRSGIDISANTGHWSRFKGKGSMIEHLAWRASRKPIYLGPDKAMRHHPHVRHRKTKSMVAHWLRKNITGITKEDLKLLDIDFKD